MKGRYLFFLTCIWPQLDHRPVFGSEIMFSMSFGKVRISGLACHSFVLFIVFSSLAAYESSTSSSLFCPGVLPWLIFSYVFYPFFGH